MLPDEPIADPFADHAAELPPDSSVPVGPPRLTIFYLFVWTALTALALGVYTYSDSAQSSPEARKAIKQVMETPSAMIYRTASAMATGANLGGLLIMFVYWRRGLRFPVQPGEWLLVMQGVSSLVLLTLTVVRAVVISQDTVAPGNFPYWMFGIITMLVALLEFGIPAFRCKERGPWKWFFWLATLSPVVLLIVLFSFLIHLSYSFYLPIYWGSIGLCGLILLVAILTDHRRHLRRSWLHWLGIITLTSVYIVPFVSTLFGMAFLRR
jgi:hypothetical protein